MNTFVLILAVFFVSEQPAESCGELCEGKPRLATKVSRFICTLFNLLIVAIASSQIMDVTYVPEGSSVHINCTAEEPGQLVEWRLQSTSLPQETLYRSALESQLQGLGYYQIREDDENILLFINNTDLDHTNVTCVGEIVLVRTTTIFQTTLLTYSKCL